jgi:hypothetical protein
MRLLTRCPPISCPAPVQIKRKQTNMWMRKTFVHSESSTGTELGGSNGRSEKAGGGKKACSWGSRFGGSDGLKQNSISAGAGEAAAGHGKWNTSKT